MLKCVKCGHTSLDIDGGPPLEPRSTARGNPSDPPGSLAGVPAGTAGWKCPACGAAFPIIDGVARFVASEHYTGSFGYQWNTFAQAQLDSANGTTRSKDTFVEKTGLSLESLRGKRVLDAGCGMGRFAEVCINAGAEVHAIHLSTAVEAAARNLGHHPNVSFYQADIMNLPFADGTFRRGLQYRGPASHPGHEAGLSQPVEAGEAWRLDRHLGVRDEFEGHDRW